MKNKLCIFGIILTAVFLTACGNSDNNVMDKVNSKVTFEVFHLKESENGVLLNEEEFVSILESTTLTEAYYLETSKKIEEMRQEIIAERPDGV